MPNSEKKSCFVIAPIGEPESDTRKRSDQVLKHIIRPAAEEAGYKAERADEIDKPGIITSQVIQRIVTDDLVIADLTETNPNVFYELAIRHAITKPLVQIIMKGERIPFDIASTRTIYFDHHDLDSVESAKTEIKNQIKNLEENPDDLETPISVSLDLQKLRQSEDPEDRSIAEIVSLTTSMSSSIKKIEDRILSQADDNEGARVTNRVMRRLEELSDNNSLNILSMNNRKDPYIIREFIHYLRSEGLGGAAIVVVASLFKEMAPWLYELGMDIHRYSIMGKKAAAIKAAKDFKELTKLTLHGPISRELYAGNKKVYMTMDYLADIVYEFDLFLEEFLNQKS